MDLYRKNTLKWQKKIKKTLFIQTGKIKSCFFKKWPHLMEDLNQVYKNLLWKIMLILLKKL